MGDVFFMDNLKEEYPSLSEDLKYYNSTLYNQCREYIKLFLLLEELLVVKDYDVDELILTDVCDGILVKMGILLNEIHVSLMKLRTLYDVDGTVFKENGFDRFNYSLGVNELFAVVTDSSDEKVRIRVHSDDVDSLDELLNGLNKNYVALIGANRRLDDMINRFNRLLSLKLDDDGVDDGVKEQLKLLQLELL